MYLLKSSKTERIRRRNFKFGEEWEEEVRENFFIPDFYDLIEKTHNYKQNKKDYVKTSLNPDYRLLCKYTKKEFHVEWSAVIADLLDELLRGFYHSVLHGTWYARRVLISRE